MSITSLSAGLAPLTQATPRASSAQAFAPSRQIQEVRPHHGHGGGKPAKTTGAGAGSVTSASATGTKLNRLV